jgi:hypothetical protein
MQANIRVGGMCSEEGLGKGKHKVGLYCRKEPMRNIGAKGPEKGPNRKGMEGRRTRRDRRDREKMEEGSKEGGEREREHGVVGPGKD